MTPYEIRIMLHYETMNDDYEGSGEPILPVVLASFVADGLLTESDNRSIAKRRYSITEKGRAYCVALESVPLPIQRWEIKWPDR